VPLTDQERALLKPYAGKTIVLGVRPEDIVAGGDVRVKVFSNENLGMNTLVHGHLLSDGKTTDRITCKLRGWCDYKAGDTVPVTFVRKHFFDKETTDAIRGEA
jgi:multiple sugar transport system ATP-binding protein